MIQLRTRIGIAVSGMLALLSLPVFLWPGLFLVRDLMDPAMRGPGIPTRAWELHANLSDAIEPWARERIATGRAAHAPLHDVPTTEWPMFTAVFYLMATEQLTHDWEQSGGEGPSPLERSGGAVEAAKDLILDPSHHTWVHTHWGDDYLHRENVFFRGLIIAGLTSYEQITGDRSVVPMLRDQVETLSAELDASPLGVLDDYPGECYPIDVLATIAFIRNAERSTGVDTSAFVARSLRAFEGPMADSLGLVPFRMDLPHGDHVQPSRGIGNSWILMFSPDAYGMTRSREWYALHEAHFYQRRWWAEGFREWQHGTAPEWGFEIDAGPVLDGFGTAANAFGIGAARRHGRFDHAYALSAQMAAASWTWVDGTLLLPRLVSHGTDAPYLGEAGILYFLTVQPADDAHVPALGLPSLAEIGLLVFFGVPAFAWWAFIRRVRALRRRRSVTAARPTLEPAT